MESKALIFSSLYLFNIILNNFEGIKTKFVAICISIKNAWLWLKENWKSKEHRRILIIFFINLALKELIDLYITPEIMSNYGPVASTIWSVVIYLIIGLSSLYIYDKLKIDLLWVEAFKKAKEDGVCLEEENFVIKFIFKKSELNEFILQILSFFKNPALMVIIKRPGQFLYNGFASNKIRILFTIYLLGMNVYWNLMIFFGISIKDILIENIKIFFS